MNKIEGILDKSDYEDYYNFINFKIDGYWLDEKLDQIYPDNMFKGLIPTLVFWLDGDDEKLVVWQRILPKENETSICPILMCPDDCDFSCTLIVAEVRNYGTFIQWAKLGIDETNEWDAEKVGTKVRWFDKFPVLNFEKSDYLKAIETFKDQFELDKVRIEDEIKAINKETKPNKAKRAF